MTVQKDRMSKPGRWLKVTLITSLTLNLLFVGLAAGAFLRVGSHAKHDRSDRLMPLIMALPKVERDTLRLEFQERVERRRERHAVSSHDRMQKLLVLLREQPFDADALHQHFNERILWHEQRLNAGRDALVVRIIGLSDTERAEYADRLERRARRWRKD